LHDTAAGRVVDVTPRTEGRFSMYVCGPTVYGPPHIGHGRMTLTFDVLRRYLEWTGVEVHHVSNVTDIDDHIINRALKEERPAEEIAVKCEAMWWKAMDALGALRPHDIPHATEYVERMVELVGELVEAGYAYETSDGVYFAVEKLDGYGLLAGQPLDSLRAGARVEVDEEKRSPVDFALWKKAKPNEPFWDSPWGAGRPGWHTECVVMSLDLLGDGFDLHGGGQDLKFPHHENERAQAVAMGRRFSRFWMHNGWVEVEGVKMSKSLGNYVNLLDLIERSDPRAYRLLVLRSHYRSPLEVTPETIADAEESLERLDLFARRARELAVAHSDEEVLARFRAHMDDDLGTPGSLAVLFDTVRRANAALDAGDAGHGAPLAAAALEIAGSLGLTLHAEEADAPADVQELARLREEAREGRNFAAADRFRDEIAARGWLVEDTAHGPRLRPS